MKDRATQAPKKIYHATKNSDQTEGRGHTVTVGYFTRRSDAARAVRGLGAMGMSDGDVHEVTLFDTFEQFDRKNRAASKRDIKEKALHPTQSLYRAYGVTQGILSLFGKYYVVVTLEDGEEVHCGTYDSEVQARRSYVDSMRAYFNMAVNVSDATIYYASPATAKG